MIGDVIGVRVLGRTASLLVLIGACGGSSGTATAPPTPPSVASIKIQGSGLPLPEGATAFLGLVVRDQNGESLKSRATTWVSSNPAIVSVSSSGAVTGMSRTGNATITATSEGKTDSITVTTCWDYVYDVKPMYTVVEQSLTISDGARGRTIPIVVQLPREASGSLPVVFQPFALPNGERTDGALGFDIAAAGYVVIRSGTAAFSQGQLCAELRVTDCDAMIWPGRISTARDVSVLMDNLASIGRELGIALDSTRVAVTGTSSGGAVVMYLAGATVDLSPTVTGVSLADKRFAAFLANSAPATRTDNGSASGFSSTSWLTVTKPTMQQVLAADADAQGRRGIYEVMPPGDKYLSYYSSSALVSYDPSQAGDLRDLLRSTTLAFLDAYLRAKPDAKLWLTTNQSSRSSNQLAQTSSK